MKDKKYEITVRYIFDLMLIDSKEQIDKGFKELSDFTEECFEKKKNRPEDNPGAEN